MIGNIFKEYKIAILLYIIYLISSFFYNIFNLLIIDKFSPASTAIAFMSENLADFIIETVRNKIKNKIDIDYKFWIRFAMFILLIISSCIFNEFWVIDLCGLANGTKFFLDYKEQKDIYLIDDTKITKQEKDKNIYLSYDDIKESIPTSFFGDSLNSVELKDL